MAARLFAATAADFERSTTPARHLSRRAIPAAVERRQRCLLAEPRRGGAARRDFQRLSWARARCVGNHHRTGALRGSKRAGRVARQHAASAHQANRRRRQRGRLPPGYAHRVSTRVRD
eukprot:6078459-Prymnesium_polylepis.1